MAKKALITGVTGQDGSYLADFLLEKGYEVYGMVRRSSMEKFDRIEHIKDRIQIRQADLLDQYSISKIIEEVQPDEVYNLAAMSFVPTSWDQPVLTAEFTAIGVTRMLEAIRAVNPRIRFYQASSSEMFGKVKEIPQTELTPFHPRSPYGVAKVYGHWITVNYRESYDIFGVSGILFNHESPRRGIEFVTRKVTYNAARIKLGLSKELHLGNLEAKRDWGYALDYVEAMWLMLQQEKPDDFVIASGETHSVKELVEIAFSHLGLDYKDFVVLDKKFIRPAEVDLLRGDFSKAKKILGWQPKVHFAELVKMMVDADLALLKKDYRLMNYKEERPWGWFEILFEEAGLKVKRIMVKPGKAAVPAKPRAPRRELGGGAGAGRWSPWAKERSSSSRSSRSSSRKKASTAWRTPASEELVFIEVQTGTYLGEDDITRFQDDFDRC